MIRGVLRLACGSLAPPRRPRSPHQYHGKPQVVPIVRRMLTISRQVSRHAPFITLQCSIVTVYAKHHSTSTTVSQVAPIVRRDADHCRHRGTLSPIAALSGFAMLWSFAECY
jgi:hypothetical protein